MSRFSKILVLALVGTFFLPTAVYAGVVDDLQKKIAERTLEILKLEADIKAYHEELDRTTKQAQGLDNALALLNLTDKKLATSIKVTEAKVASAIDSITALGYDIDITGARINDGSLTLKSALRGRYELETYSLAEIMLAHPTFSSFWTFVTYLEAFQKNVGTHLAELKDLKSSLEDKEARITEEKANLLAYKGNLLDQKDIIEVNKDEKERLLAETKNKESLYESLLAERLKKKEALEQEIADFEERLKVEIDPESLPETGTGVLAWPFDSVVVTQYFGNTPFASANPQVYNGLGHNGIDLRGAIGTPVKAAANGVVVDTGDTDAQCYKVSYGKWVLVRHYNGLSTLYAHLSLIRAQPGDEISRGDIVGYSGNGGYSTGPHLHFTVYATAAVSISEPTGPNKYVSKICGTYLKLPLSAKNGYLNPLSYLSKI
ncbi:MAG: hypothetical protein A3D67_00810 [Candidatus Lloydbacteria bacterium RIFCSPHIGHO2_02_FULL_51_22]|uniref:M23ase beta-sheet core domain-containing protein n=2 Tax=Candidatus Lloydiibacteriota TaxID=1817910 RepID=A0A1G2DEX3_9BACT|nr:MAG: hypothetical protein A3D67_00810 [Candidatus Lloydbacteria bacterium RIFCSPHIGHO2_02_FULL_51_22]OGZ15296.1 MAG: hypothetical protein A3J08_00750 [Candidatus Lloydbacteria bacterium RIFCSPLOWO2_02_FULL_51_11]